MMECFLFFLIISFGLLSDLPPLNAIIPAIERAPLIAFYNSTNSDLWTDICGWKTRHSIRADK